MSRKVRSVCIFVLLFTLSLSLLPLSVSAADALPEQEIRDLLNNQPLYPQPTGYEELDALMEEILAPYDDADTYTRVKAAYDWTVFEINYSWAPYSQDWAPAYDCFVPKYDLSYDPGLEEVIPYEVANRSYHAMKYGEGVCYDYAAAFALLARYIGIDSYVHTGNFHIEPLFGNTIGHHGWAELCIHGENYIFDPQRDYRFSWDGTAENPYYYFAVPMENAWRYSPEEDINAARDAQFLPVAQERKYTPVITVSATASGIASGSGTYDVGETVTAHAWGENFMGWYDPEGTLLSTDNPYYFPAEETMTLRAVFANELFEDIPENAWYRKDAVEAAIRGLIRGTEPFTFSGESPVTRAMAVTMLYRAASAPETDGENDFTDVPENSWFTPAVAWAARQGIVNGMGDGRFCPHMDITREQLAVILLRYAACAELSLPEATAQGPDAHTVSPYAAVAVGQAQALGILQGDPDGSIRPQDTVTRAECVTMLLRLLRILES